MHEDKKKILVVDDDPASLSLVLGILSEMYRVYPISSGEDALDFLSMQQPDLMLLDMEMPDMNGKELFSIIKKNQKLSDIPVIFLTGNIDNESEIEAFKIGAADFIRKPINGFVLLKRVQMHLTIAALQVR